MKNVTNSTPHLRKLTRRTKPKYWTNLAAKCTVVTSHNQWRDEGVAAASSDGNPARGPHTAGQKSHF